MSEMSRDAGESRDSGKRQTDRETNSLKATTGAFFAVGVDVIKYQNNVYSQTKSSVPPKNTLQSNQVKRTPQEPINEFIIQKLNPLLVVDFRLVSAFLYV